MRFETVGSYEEHAFAEEAVVGKARRAWNCRKWPKSRATTQRARTKQNDDLKSLTIVMNTVGLDGDTQCPPADPTNIVEAVSICSKNCGDEACSLIDGLKDRYREPQWTKMRVIPQTLHGWRWSTSSRNKSKIFPAFSIPKKYLYRQNLWFCRLVFMANFTLKSMIFLWWFMIRVSHRNSKLCVMWCASALKIQMIDSHSFWDVQDG